jgi:hypothetical protein
MWVVLLAMLAHRDFIEMGSDTSVKNVQTWLVGRQPGGTKDPRPSARSPFGT